MIALLDDASVVHHTDDVGITNGGETMGNDEGGTSFHDVVHSFLHQSLRARVDARGGFVEDERRRIGNGGTGNGKQLTLTLTEVASICSEHGVVTL